MYLLHLEWPSPTDCCMVPGQLYSHKPLWTCRWRHTLGPWHCSNSQRHQWLQSASYFHLGKNNKVIKHITSLFMCWWKSWPKMESSNIKTITDEIRNLTVLENWFYTFEKVPFIDTIPKPEAEVRSRLQYSACTNDGSKGLLEFLQFSGPQMLC